MKEEVKLLNTNDVSFIKYGPYGPDKDRGIHAEHVFTWKPDLKPGQKAVLSFTSNAGLEMALLIYPNNGNPELPAETVLLEAGTPPIRDWHNKTFSNVGGTYIVTSWQKHGNSWHQAMFRFATPQTGDVAAWEFESDEHNGDYSAIRVRIKIQ
jgi:hypothetical protein